MKKILRFAVTFIALFFFLSGEALAEDVKPAQPDPTPVVTPEPIPVVTPTVSTPEFRNYTLGFGGMGGFAVGASSEAIDGYDETDFGVGGALGADVFFGTSSQNNNSIGVDVSLEYYTLELTEKSEELGKLSMTPILVSLMYQSFPKTENGGLGGYLGIGLGWVTSSFENGSSIKELETQYRGKIDVETEGAFAWGMCAGLDVFLNKNLAIVLDTRFVSATVKNKWKASVGNVSGTIADEEFNTCNLQVLGGVKYFLR